MNLRAPSSVAIIGGGPAGLIAAEKLAETGLRVTIYDHKPSLGRKFLMAGHGGLNLTHSEHLDVFLTRYGVAQKHLAPALQAFPPAALLAWSHELGIETFVGSSGRIFPVGLKASPLLRAWLRRLEKLDAQVALRHRWMGWSEDGALVFTREDGTNHHVKPDATLLALGGSSWKRLGSDGAWTSITDALGLPRKPFAPANCGFVADWTESFAARFAGQPVKPVVLHFGERSLQGEMMITAQGIEGSCVYALSGALREALQQNAGKPVILTADLRPGLSVDQLASRLRAPRGSQSLSTYLRKAGGLSPVAIGLVREVARRADLPLDSTEDLVRAIKELPLPLSATASLDRAISSAGGLSFDALDTNFMIREKPGVFAAGEMLDWEAPTGGYLLQACFSTGVAAAAGILSWLHHS